MQKIKILVLLGGDSPEREISLKSGKAVADAIDQKIYDVSIFDTKKGLKELEAIVDEYDLILPILHGINGEDGVVQNLLEQKNIKFLGTKSEESKNCFDKVKTHKILSNAKIDMPKYEVITIQSFKECNLLKRPFVVKPINGGSSLDTVIVRDVSVMPKAEIENVFMKYDKLLIEELVEGTEVTVAILDKKALPLITIIVPENEEFDYENKYNGKSQEICPTPEELLPVEIQENCKDLALKVHNALKARHYSRVDMIIKDDGSIKVLELNTIPGLTEQSLFPKAAKADGKDMKALVNELINTSMKG